MRLFNTLSRAEEAFEPSRDRTVRMSPCRYKEGEAFQVSDIQRFSWLRQLLEWQENLQDPQEFLHSLKEDLFAAGMYVFTPKGDLLHFLRGPTAIDVAYRR